MTAGEGERRCPRCGGLIVQQRDEDGPYWFCSLCGDYLVGAPGVTYVESFDVGGGLTYTGPVPTDMLEGPTS